MARLPRAQAGFGIRFKLTSFAAREFVQVFARRYVRMARCAILQPMAAFAVRANPYIFPTHQRLVDSRRLGLQLCAADANGGRPGRNLHAPR